MNTKARTKRSNSFDELIIIDGNGKVRTDKARPHTKSIDDTRNISSDENHRTDTGNARRLVERHGRDMRYVHPWESWMVWNGKCWEKDQTGAPMQRAKDTVKQMYRDAAESDDRKEAARFAMQSESERSLRAMISLAKSEPEVVALPQEFDKHAYLLNCRNGTIDLKTGQLLPHRQANMITKTVPIDYDPSAECPNFLAFLNQIMQGDQDMIAFLRRAIGYSLTGEVGEQALFILVGNGDNGKSTLILVLRALLGPYAQNVKTATLLKAKFEQSGSAPTEDIAALQGSRFLSASEFGADQVLDEEKIKNLTSKTPLVTRHPHGTSFEVVPSWKLWVDTNNLPIIRGTDHGILKRPRLIPFNVTIKKKDENYFEHALEPELSGILSWAVQGCLEWQQKKLGTALAIAEATSSYFGKMDTLGGFIKDCCVLGVNHRVTGKTLYDAYKAWCNDNGEPLTKKTAFNDHLRERGFVNQRGTGNVPTWVNLGLAETAHDVSIQESPSAQSRNNSRSMAA